MALHGNQNNEDPADAHPLRADQKNTLGVGPAKFDEMLLDALEAFEQARRLHESTPNPETKRLIRLILQNLHASLLKLAPLGIHSAQRLDRMPLTF